MIYLDNAASTKTYPEVVELMKTYYLEEYGNPGSNHTKGKEAKEAVEDARRYTAKILGAQPKEIIFTSSATESVNLAIKGVAFAKGKGHIITTKTEHKSVLDTCKWLSQNGFTVTYLPVDAYGRVAPGDLREAIQDDTILVSIIYANNEIGTINDIASLGAIAKEHNIAFHTDACQGALLDLDVNTLNVDLLTLNGSKLNGPKGVGVLYKREDVKIVPLLHGGEQEHGLRAGTHNVPAIVGFAKALEITRTTREEESTRLTQLRDQLTRGLKMERSFLNGHPTQRMPNSVSITYADVEGEALLEALDHKGIAASMGSACTSFILKPSHVILAIGMPQALAHGTLRFTLGHDTTEEDIKKTIDIVRKSVEELRAKSPVRVDDTIIAERTQALGEQ